MVRPEIGVSMLYCLGEPFGKMVKQIPKAEVTYIEVVDDGLHALNRRRVLILKSIAKSYGLKYSVHAPFAGINIAAPSRVLLNATLKRLRQSVVNANALDSELWVFHPAMKTGISMFYPGMDWAKNLEGAKLLVKTAREYGMEAAIENVMEPFVMKSVEDFERFYAEFNDDIGLVLDTGHAHINGQLIDFLKGFSKKIVHVHAHDNRGKTDQHLGIGHGSIDWQETAELLKKASYSKVVMVESVEHVAESVQKLKQLFG